MLTKAEQFVEDGFREAISNLMVGQAMDSPELFSDWMRYNLEYLGVAAPYEPFIVRPRECGLPSDADEVIHITGNAEAYGRDPEERTRFRTKIANYCITPRRRGECYLCLCGWVRYDDRTRP